MNRIKQLILSIVFIFIFQSLAFGQGSTYGGTFVNSAPIALNGVSNRTISGLSITNPGGHCISLRNCSNITVQNCKLGPSLNEGVYLYNCTNITVINNTMDTNDTGVVADGCTGGIKVTHNDVKNVQGPMPRGQMVQFGHVTGGGNSISYNVLDNVPNQSHPEDAISLFITNGIAGDPIQVIGNWIRGGGPSTSGGGIMTGDEGGSYVTVQDNILVDPGQYGITISSGHHIIISNNTIYAKQQPFSNIGLSAYNQYPAEITNSNTIMNNQVNYTNKSGVLNNLWNAGNAGVITGWDTNTYNPNLSASILPVKIIGRAQSTVTAIVPIPINSSIKIYPNPASDHLTIETTPDIDKGTIVIYNINGQKIIEQIVKESNTEIDTHNLTTGVYIVKVSNADKLIEEKKIIIRRN